MLNKIYFFVALMCVSNLSLAETYQCQFTELKTPSSGGFKPYKGEITKIDFNESRLINGTATFVPINGQLGVPGPMESLAYSYRNSNTDVISIFKTRSIGVVIVLVAGNFRYQGGCK